MLHARLAYNDALVAIAAIGEGESEEMRRVYWTAAISLLRTSMYVLKNVDSAKDDSLSKKVESAWQKLNASKPEPAIFWEFIDKERHLVLKQYEPSADLEDSFLKLETGGYLLTETGGRLALETFLKMTSGPFKGQDGRKVLRTAAEWVDDFLKKFE